MITTNTWKRPASSGLEDILSGSWIGDDVRAVCQIAHGMSEYSARYDEFARFLAERGYAVYMNDHSGHGEAAETLGFFAPEDGISHVVSDMKALMDEASSAHPDVPLFLMGHSMGSFLARKYITLYGEDLSGCVLSGTAGPTPGTSAGILLAKAQKSIKGAKSRATMIGRISFGSYLKRIDDPVNIFAWLSRDDDVCISYKADPLCGYSFTAGGYYDLLSLLKEINRPDWAARVPENLPIYLISGSDDPVGAYGEGVIKVREMLRGAGITDVSAILYPGGRHEMLNEINKAEVMADIAAWMDSHML